jgi:hypothetical protein
LAFLIAACGSVDPADHQIWNNSSRPLVIVALYESGESVIAPRVEPGTFYPWLVGTGSCVNVVLVARDSGGSEIARRSGPFCPQDKWIVTDPSPAP